MKLNLDPMPALRAVAIAKINAQFNTQAQPHVDAAHDAKRKAAAAGAPYPDWFTAEAALRGITPEALATLIASKPDNVGARELARQQTLAAIAAATSPAELDSIVKGNQ
jgi:hypothetical protein